MYKLDPVTLDPKDKNNKETHIYYLEHIMEQVAILRVLVEQAKSLNPLDSASYSAYKYVKLIQELLGYVRDTFLDIHKPGEKLVAVTPINKKKIVRHELCFLKFVSDMNASFKSKSVKKTKKKEEWRPTGRIFTLVRNACLLTRITANNKVPLREPIPLEVIAQKSAVTKFYTRRPKVPKTNGSNSKPKIAKSVISNKTEPCTSRRSNTSVALSSSSVNLRKTPYELLHDRKLNLSYLYVFGALCYLKNDSDDLGKLQAKADIGIFIGYAPKKKSYRIYYRRTQKLIETIHVNFDELTAMASKQLVPVAAAPRVVNLSDSPVSTSIDQDAPSTSIPSTQDQEHSPIISQGFEESPKTPHFHDDPLHEPLHEDSISQGSSSNVRPIHTSFESLGRWTKDHPISNVIRDPSHYVSTRKQL
nr:retrovirus-related Pol polyprotein from transposon TNT 1-94 [Tanacetum cinerariifolium]